MELGNLNKLDNGDVTGHVKFGADGEVLIKYILKERLLALSKQAERPSWGSGHQKEMKVDTAIFGKLLGREGVLGWENLTVGGKPFSYSPENCDLLMAKSYQFYRFVDDSVTDIIMIEKGRQEEKKKNQRSHPSNAGFSGA